MLTLLSISTLTYPHPIQRRYGPIEQAFFKEHKMCLQQLRLQAIARDYRRLHHIVNQRADYQQYLQRKVYFVGTKKLKQRLKETV